MHRQHSNFFAFWDNYTEFVSIHSSGHHVLPTFFKIGTNRLDKFVVQRIHEYEYIPLWIVYQNKLNYVSSVLKCCFCSLYEQLTVIIGTPMFTSQTRALLSVYSVQSTWNYVIFARGLCLCIYTSYLLLVSVPANRTVFGAVPPSATLKAILGCSTSTAGDGVFSAAASAVSGVGDDGTCGAGWSGGGGGGGALCTACTSGCWAPEVVRISRTEHSSDR